MSASNRKPNKHKPATHCWFNVGLQSQTQAQIEPTMGLFVVVAGLTFISDFCPLLPSFSAAVSGLCGSCHRDVADGGH